MTEPIRILHIVQRMEAGGSQALLMNIYRNIDRTKIQFDFLVEYEEKQFYDDEIESLGGKIYRTSVREDFNILKFQKYLHDFFVSHPEYKVIHVHAYTIGVFCLKAAKDAGIPVRIAHSHNNGIVHDKAYPIKFLLKKLYPLYATDLFACSEEAGKYFFGKRKYSVLKNGIDSQKFKANHDIRTRVRRDLNLRDEELVVGNIGRLHPQKNQCYLLHIFKFLHQLHPNSTLLIVGTGELESALKKECTSLGINDSVRFLGNRKDIPRLEQAFDVLAMPSQFEGLGIVAIESQAAGIPTLCSTGFAPDVEITPLVRRKDLGDSPESWARAILELSRSPLRHTDTSQAIVDSGYDIGSIAPKMQEYYINKFLNK